VIELVSGFVISVENDFALCHLIFKLEKFVCGTFENSCRMLFCTINALEEDKY
jgi:hypothetical protein